MKKRTLALALTIVMVLSLAACGKNEGASDETELISVEANGLSLDLPGDIQYLKTDETSGAMIFANEEKTVVVTVSAKSENAVLAEDITDEILLQSMNRLSDAVLNDSNTVEQGGGTAVVGFGEGTLADGTAMTSVIQCFIPADSSGYSIISYLYGTDAGSSMDANIEGVLDSVTFAE